METELAKRKDLAASANKLPVYRCKIGGELKSLENFSIAQRKILNYRRGVDCGMTCKDHTRQNRSEIKCDLCGLWKSLDSYSKSARKNDSPTCQRCTAWTETQEPDIAPSPLETGAISRDEETGEVWRERCPTDGSEWFEEKVLQACATDLGSFNLSKESDLKAMRLSNDTDVLEIGPGSRALNQGKPRSAASSTLGHMQNENGSTGSNFGEASSVASSQRKLPPHMLARARKTASEVSSTASTSESSTADAYSAQHSYNSVSTATTLREALVQRSALVPFNAWPADGIQRQGTKVPTIPSTASVASTSDMSAVSGGDAGSRDSYNDTVLHSIDQNVPNKRGWPRPLKIRRAPSTVAPVFDPKIDRGTVLKFADSDDEDDYEVW